MRTYRKRSPEQRHCVHCAKPFESGHKRRIYCGNSCSTLAYYARKKAKGTTVTQLGTPSELANGAPTAPAQVPATTAPPAVTLAANWQNTAVLTASSLLADAIKYVAGKFFAPAPHKGPSTWLPAELRTPQAPLLPLVPLQHADWEEPLFFRPLPYEGEFYYFRAQQELLLWQDPQGQWHQVFSQHGFERLTAHLRICKRVELPAGTSLPALPPGAKGLKTLEKQVNEPRYYTLPACLNTSNILFSGFKKRFSRALFRKIF